MSEDRPAARALTLSYLLLALVATPLGATERAEQLIRLPDGGRLIGPTLTFPLDPAGREALAAPLRDLAEADRVRPGRFAISSRCLAGASGPDAADRCGLWAEELARSLAQAGAVDTARVPLLAGVLEEPGSPGTEADRPGGTLEGLRLEVERLAPSVVVDPGRAVPGEGDRLWTSTDARPLEVGERLRLHPLLAPHEQPLVLPGRSEPEALTADLWFAAIWIDPPQGRPTLLSIAGTDGTLLTVHLLPDRSGIAIWDGVARDLADLPFAFAPGRPHHLVVRAAADGTSIAIDGEPIGQLPIGYRGGQPRRLVLGALTEGHWPFEGYLGRVRLWPTALADRYLPALPQTARITEDMAAWPALVLETASDAASFRLRERPVVVRPKAGWWRQANISDTRIHNLGAFLDGRAAPSLSPLHQALAAKRAGRVPLAPAERDAFAQLDGLDGTSEHPLFSVHPLYRIAVDDGLDPGRFALVDRYGEALELSAPPEPSHHVSAIVAEIDEATRSIRELFLVGCPGEPARQASVIGLARELGEHRQALQRIATAECRKAPGERRPGWHWLSGGEEIRGFSHGFSGDGRISDLRFHTGDRTIGPIAGDPRAVGGLGASGATRSMWLDDGVGFNGLVAGGTDGLQGLAFIVPDGTQRAGMTLYAESGAARRYTQVDPLRLAAEVAPPNRTLVEEGPDVEVLSPTRLLLSGNSASGPRIPLEYVGAAPPVVASDTYNNTFVSLSKAVNLQANYLGYDIVQMDPVHLVRTGTSAPIFKPPDGESKDYYDANRIFVPRGLRYVPELTGEVRSTVHDTTSYWEFKDAVSDSVSIGLDSKALPVSFSMSQTLSRARETIAEQHNTKTLGRSRAIFYDLVLEKNEISLDDYFVEQVVRLVEYRDYASFIETFGTHYATAVVYGGMGVLDIEMTSSMRSALQEKGVDSKTEVGLVLDAQSGTQAKLGTGSQSQSSQLFRSVVGSQAEQFHWIGGSHAGIGSEGWSVGADGVVPVHVTLRPIDELLAPTFFADPAVHVRVRAELRAAIAAYYAAHESLVGGLPSVPREGVLEVRMDSLTCGLPPSSDRILSHERLLRSGGAPSPAAGGAFQWWWDVSTNRMYLGRPGSPGESTSYRGAMPAIDPAAGPPIPIPGTTVMGFNLSPADQASLARRLSAATVYPMVWFAAWGREGRALRNLVGAQDDNTKHEPFAATCSTSMDLVPKSPFLQLTKEAGFGMSPSDIVHGAALEIVDARDLEHLALHPKPEQISNRDAALEGFEIGITAGLKYVCDELFTDGGSKAKQILHPAKQVVPPRRDDTLLPILGLFCGGRAVLVSRCEADIIAGAGRWRPAREIRLPAPHQHCDGCVDYVLRLSVRYVQ